MPQSKLNEVGIRPLEIFHFFLRWKWLLLAFVLSVTTSVYFVSLFLPKQYVAFATLLPFSASSNISSQYTQMFMGLVSGSTPVNAQHLVGILKSRTLRERVVSHIQEEKGFAFVDLGKVSFKMETTEATFEISVTHRDPELAAKIANAYVLELSRYLNENALSIYFHALDPAVPSFQPVSPDVRKNVFASGVVSFVIAGFSLFYFENRKKIKENLVHERMTAQERFAA